MKPESLPYKQLPVGKKILRFIITVLKVFFASSGLQRCAALAFGTLFAIFPLVSVLLFLLPAFFPAESASPTLDNPAVVLSDQATTGTLAQSLSMRRSVRGFIIASLLPADEEMKLTLEEYFFEFQSGFEKEMKKIGIFGLILLLVIAIALFIGVEKTFNDIWKVKRRRSFLKASTVFAGVIVWIPLFIGLTLYVTQELMHRTELSQFLPFLLALLALTLAYLYIPNTQVRLSCAFGGAVMATLFWWIARAIFGQSTKIFLNFTNLIAAVGAVPYYLSWLYFVWVIILLGVVISYCSQNFRTIMIEDLSRTITLLDPVVLLSLVYILADHFKGEKGLLNFARVRNFCPIGTKELVDHLSYLEGQGIIGQTGDEEGNYFLKKPPEKIKPSEFINNFQKSQRIFYYESPAREKLLELIRKSDETLTQYLSQFSVADIISGQLKEHE